ncbi:hypothetical protein ACA40_22415 [Pseudomonas syringae pv. lapsa]|nr:hypothetical protein ACA40_22415 [Pseudomonas syringae pv. lapsa]PHN50130.1 hypothetical protein AO254_13560 [Pseudomonas syringae]
MPGLYPSGDESWSLNLMRTVAPQIKAVEHPVQFLNRQYNRLVAYIRRCFEALGFQALEPKAKI